ncbi:diguanylate cyclase [Shewanella avicenniae]|uniref:Diguanylate cyclase n=1 Tax=Shewanella avicenniae TaxID=2814294 RepID=A0ABX7QV00_9GAMM|nr:diguanylate cyclase [Shewanella avicenniae]QSX35307.1 diguanylate cyclase [Shewanella avicenniae]
MMRSYEKINQLIEVQLSIDLVRSNLWLLQQFQDAKAINETRDSLARLSRITNITSELKLNQYELRLLQNIQRHEQNLDTLLGLTERNLKNIANSNEPLTSNATLTARYNMIIQSLSEDSLRFQQITIRNSQQSEKQHLYINAALVLAIAILVSIFSIQTLTSFKRKFYTLMQGIDALAKGDLSSKVTMSPGDEFAELGDAFNEMKSDLTQTMQRRDELQQEVQRQTEQLLQQQEKLRQMAEYDDLTGVYNRGAAQNYISLSLERCKREGLQAALLFIDLDKFKPINDQYGHKVGDFVLKAIAERLKEKLRASDIIARIGGDEFIIWLDPIKDRQQLESVKLKLDNIGNGIFVDEINGMLDVGLSIGFSIFPNDGETITALIGHADQKMYLNKKQRKDTQLLDADSIPVQAIPSTQTPEKTPFVFVDFRPDK